MGLKVIIPAFVLTLSFLRTCRISSGARYFPARYFATSASTELLAPRFVRVDGFRVDALSRYSLISPFTIGDLRELLRFQHLSSLHNQAQCLVLPLLCSLQSLGTIGCTFSSESTLLVSL